MLSIFKHLSRRPTPNPFKPLSTTPQIPKPSHHLAAEPRHFNALIAASCLSGDASAAASVLRQMKISGCRSNAGSYNYLLGWLFKNGMFAEGCDLLREMEAETAPDAVTFEVLVFQACRIGRMDCAEEFVGRMVGSGVRPRLTTHGKVIKSYFELGRAAEARDYVVGVSHKDGGSANWCYSLLARLLCVAGRLEEASRVLREMMDKGLKPEFRVYLRVVRGLHMVGRRDVAFELRNKFAEFPKPVHCR